LVIVDSTLQPTPVARLLPHVLRQFQQCGLPPSAVRVLVATGVQGAPRPESLLKKLGPAAADCEVIIHDPNRHLVNLGNLPSGIRILANHQVPASDFVVGVGGVYPNEDPRFEAGLKLALGVLGIQTIRDLKSRFPDAFASQYGDGSEFPRVLEQIADKIGLRTMISAHVDAEREVVRVACGDPRLYYAREVEFARNTFRAPPPADADVVLSNAYPTDLSLATVEYALAPLRHAARDASRVVLASCAEGIGTRTLDELAPGSSFRRWLRPLKQVTFGSSRDRRHRHPIWLYRPGDYVEEIPGRAGEIRVAPSWEDVVRNVRQEQMHKKFLRVHLYPCAPLQFLVGPSTLAA
jgi:nickel-dependent lactate racemase